MNPLVTHAPHFTNGEFEANINQIRPIVGCRIRNGNYEIETGYPQSSTSWYGAKRCTLVARPISDILDEELLQYERMRINPMMDVNDPSQEQIDRLREQAINWHELGITADRFMYYLSIGIYPFDQRHFDDGIVININEV